MSKKPYKGETLRSKKRKILRRVLITILVILIILLIIVLAGAGFIFSKMSNINHIELKNIEINAGVKEQLKGYRNIAIFGVDSRANTYSNTRSDCIIIASINQDNKTIKLTSIYRDTYVYIDGYGYDKITHAYAYGGPELAINTINKNLDLNICEFVAVNFDAVVDIIDAIGGVEINVESFEIESINACIAEVDAQSHTNSKKVTNSGLQNLTGAQALGYSRVRNTAGGDYKRTERMRDVLNAGFRKVKTLNVGKLNNLADILLPKVYTNISSSEIIFLLPQVAQYNVTSSIGWPYDVQGITLDKWYGVPVTLESNVEKLHKELFDAKDYEVSSKVKEYSEGICKKTGYR